MTTFAKPADLTRDQRSILLYAESCAVDAGGLMEGVRMNADDHSNLTILAEAGILISGRIYSGLLGQGPNRGWTHWCVLTPAGWALAALCRIERAKQHGPYGREVFADVIERRRPEGVFRNALVVAGLIEPEAA